MNSKSQALITGANKGLGFAIAEALSHTGWSTINLGRKTSLSCNKDIIVDLSEVDLIGQRIHKTLKGNYKDLDLLVLNAATLGEVMSVSDISQESIIRDMRVNVLSNKTIIDHIIKHKNNTKLNVIAISSSASQKAISGWKSYCITKASLNMLVACYANEYPQHHFISLCPGLIKTDMQRKIKRLDTKTFPDLVNLQDSYKKMPSPKQVGSLITQCLERFQDINSGEFIKLMDILSYR